jgi:hypothetical protein
VFTSSQYVYPYPDSQSRYPGIRDIAPKSENLHLKHVLDLGYPYLGTPQITTNYAVPLPGLQGCLSGFPRPQPAIPGRFHVIPQSRDYVDRDVESRDYVDRDVESRDYVDRDVESREYGSLTITQNLEGNRPLCKSRFALRLNLQGLQARRANG